MLQAACPRIFTPSKPFLPAWAAKICQIGQLEAGTMEQSLAAPASLTAC